MISKTLGLLLLSCALVTFSVAQKVTTDFDHNANFSKYKTYVWVKNPQTSDPFMSQRIMDDVNAQLQAKGWQLTNDRDHADAGVSANVTTRERRTLDRFYGGGPWGYRWGGPVSTTVYTYDVGTLIVDVFDAGTKQPVWRGIAAQTLSDKADKNTKKLNKAVEKMFKGFPPKK